jgi:hypothetical protein
LSKGVKALKARREWRKGPTITCFFCNQTNKEGGYGNTKNFSMIRATKQNICQDCLLKYSICEMCGIKAKQLFQTYSGHYYCKTCFENLPNRSFSTTRRAALYYYGHKCAICGTDENLEVHHKNYDRKGREKFDDLVILCRKHHLIQHKKIYLGPRGGKYYLKNRKRNYIKEGDDKYLLVK